MDRLIEARLIERMTPVTEEPWKSRKRMYRIADNFLAFHLGPLLRHRSEIERGMGDLIVPSLLRSIDDHMGAAWEEAFRDHLRYLARRGDLGPDIVAVGPWWQGDGGNEIDAVVLAQPERTRVPVAVGEAKWSHTVDGRRQRDRLAVKAAHLSDRDVEFIVCARDEVRNADRDVRVVTAADMYPDPR